MEFSVLGEIGNNQSFKFLFEQDIDENCFTKRIDLILKFLSAFHTDKEKVGEYFILNENAIFSGTSILIGYDKQTKKLINLDPRQKNEE